ncbi:MAG: dTDP-4-dehydrorhamnose 3,5-epimerase [Dethiobacteria bacterium]
MKSGVYFSANLQIEGLIGTMLFKETGLGGVYLIETKPAQDQRGYFARVFCREEFEKLGLESEYAQNSISYNRQKGTLRGMHYQVESAAEVKLVQCVRGSIFDVIVDLRPESETYCGWYGVELSADNNSLLYVPEGFAHGFQTLSDHTTVYYMISRAYAPEYARGVRWNDPAFGIKWPLTDPVISEKDRQLPDYRR